MESGHKLKAGDDAIGHIRDHLKITDIKSFVQDLKSGNRAVLASAITLLESNSAQHRNLSDEIISMCIPGNGNSLRIGITGAPGVGKSTFIDAFGTMLTQLGKKVAVLAIDPSSPLSGGSILGDKTRMSRLSNDPNAFIRPSPSSLTTGGVARRTRESIILCEAAGFDTIIIETVGVGQGEVAVHGMSDFFMLLIVAGAGDQLQGIKRGIIEMADSIFITKSDSGNEKNALRARAEYLSALHLFPEAESGWMPRVEVLSSLQNRGIEVAWNIIREHESHMKSRGLFVHRRQLQDVKWMHEEMNELLHARYFADSHTSALIQQLESQVLKGEISPFLAAKKVIEK